MGLVQVLRIQYDLNIVSNNQNCNIKNCIRSIESSNLTEKVLIDDMIFNFKKDFIYIFFFNRQP